MRGCVLAPDGTDTALIARSRRALVSAGMEPEIVVGPVAWEARLRAADEPLLVLEAGAWFCQTSPIAPIPPSATGRPLLALGALRSPDGGHHPEAARWKTLLEKRGGDWNRWRLFTPPIPTPLCAYLEPEVARALGAADGRWQAVLGRRDFRKLHLSALDVFSFPEMRILQVVTSIQIGGAERVTLDLAHELTTAGAAVGVVSLGRATRASFPKPPHFTDLAHIPRTARDRAEAVAKVAAAFGADIVHGHLLGGDETRELKRHGCPVVVTLHNMPEAWPAAFGELRTGEVDLVIACSCAVEEGARRLGVTARTVWNGIDPAKAIRTPARSDAGFRLRRELGWSESDFVVLAIANPRRQKQMNRLPAILSHLQTRIGARAARLLIAGAPARGSRDAEDAANQLETAIRDSPMAADIHWLGAVQEIGDVLAVGDALLSVSAFEGLSLVHLEALAAGLPVVATDVGGTGEIAAQSPGLCLVPADASDETIADALSGALTHPKGFPRSFTRETMAARTRSLYRRILHRHEKPGDGVWLITNNFSTGGAQSSARRLLLGLAARGVKVRAAVVEEHPAHPTVGRAALLDAGIPVLAVPPPGAIDAPDAVARVLTAIDRDRPRAVLFWNLIPVFKILLADALLDVPTFDVSPGEMYFASLARYFAKPLPGLPYRGARDYGARLAGAVVKYAGEAARASATLGTPVHVVRNGVPLSKTPRARRTNQTFTIGTAARLSPDKRLMDLIDAVRIAASELPPFVLCIAGGSERGHEAHVELLREHARGLPVEWCGELPSTSDFLTRLDLFVMISEPSGCPNASLEAMAAGVSVIATDVGGASEQIVDGVTGRLVPRRDAVALARAIVDLAQDAPLRERLATAARNRIGEEFSLDQMLDGYSRICGI